MDRLMRNSFWYSKLRKARKCDGHLGSHQGTQEKYLKQTSISCKNTLIVKREPDCNEFEIFLRQTSILIKHQKGLIGSQSHGKGKYGENIEHNSELSKNQRLPSEKSHECNECGKFFSRNTYLIQHKRIRTGEKVCKCHKYENIFNVHSYLIKHNRIHTGEKLFECNDCGKAFRFLFSIREFILERNLVNKMNVGEFSTSVQTLVSIRELILQKSPMYVRNVEKPLVGAQILLNIREFILERNPINVIYVEKSFRKSKILTNIREFILEKSPMNVTIVGKPSD
ncbi:zinc finger protein 781-like [Monodelphis domestica]|nr:zinc finger protein 781-like [Monodelphis domestica]